MAQQFFTDDEIRTAVLNKMRELGIYPQNPRDEYLILDGKIHRYRIEGDKRGSKDGAYCVHTDGTPAGFVQDWKNEKYIGKFDLDTRRCIFKKTDLDHETWEKNRAKRQKELKKIQDEASDRAYEYFESCYEGNFWHKYLDDHKVKPHGIRLDEKTGQIVIPLRDINGRLQSVQTIYRDGEKRFFKDAPTEGAFFSLGLDTLQEGDKEGIIIGEGVATMLKVHELTGYPVVAAMSCDKLLNITEIIHKKYKNRKIFIAADNDLKNERSKGNNPGLDAARKVYALGYVTEVFFPPFAVDTMGSDWVDYALAFTDNGPAIRDFREHLYIHTLPEAEKEKYLHKKKLLSTLGKLDPSIELPPQEFIGGLFPRGYISAVVAPSGTGKTIFMQKFVSDLSIGGTIFDGITENEPPRKCLIFAAEAGYELLLRRAASFKWKVNPDNVIVANQYDFDRQDLSLMLHDEEGWANIQEIVDNVKPDIIFFDTFSSFHEKDENKATDMKPIIKRLTDLARDKEIAIVLNHHSRKRTAKERTLSLSQDDVIGSSIFNRLVSLIIGIEPMKENEKTLLVRPLKTWFSAFMPFTYQITEDLYGHAVVETDLAPEGINNSRLAVWNYLRENFKPGEWFSLGNIVLSEIQGNPPIWQVRRIIAKLEKDKKIIRRGATKSLEYSIVGFSDQGE